MFAPIFWPQARPCKRYAKQMPLTPKFKAHLRTCEACKAVIAHPNLEAEVSLFLQAPQLTQPREKQPAHRDDRDDENRAEQPFLNLFLPLGS
jgi:hypothetical protein